MPQPSRYLSLLRSRLLHDARGPTRPTPGCTTLAPGCPRGAPPAGGRPAPGSLDPDGRSPRPASACTGGSGSGHHRLILLFRSIAAYSALIVLGPRVIVTFPRSVAIPLSAFYTPNRLPDIGLGRDDDMALRVEPADPEAFVAARAGVPGSAVWSAPPPARLSRACPRSAAVCLLSCEPLAHRRGSRFTSRTAPRRRGRQQSASDRTIETVASRDQIRRGRHLEFLAGDDSDLLVESRRPGRPPRSDARFDSAWPSASRR